MVRLTDLAPAPPAPPPPPPRAPAKGPPASTATPELQAGVLATIARLEAESPKKAARWDDVIEAHAGPMPPIASVQRTAYDAQCKAIEDALNDLMDQGKCYEPMLGLLRVT